MEEQEARELEQRYEKLESKKTLLMRLDKTIPWSEFRPLLEKIHDKPRKTNAGRKPIDVIVIQPLQYRRIRKNGTGHHCGQLGA